MNCCILTIYTWCRGMTYTWGSGPLLRMARVLIPIGRLLMLILYTLKQPTEIVIIWKVKPTFLFVNCKFFFKKIFFKKKLTEIMKMIGDIFKYFECQNQFQCHWTGGEVVPGWNKYFYFMKTDKKPLYLGA